MEKFWGRLEMECWSTKTAISLKRVKIGLEGKLLWRAYRKSSTLFRFFGSPPYFYFRFRLYGYRDGRFALFFDFRVNACSAGSDCHTAMCVPSLVLIARAVFLLECGHSHTETQPPLFAVPHGAATPACTHNTRSHIHAVTNAKRCKDVITQAQHAFKRRLATWSPYRLKVDEKTSLDRRACSKKKFAINAVNVRASNEGNMEAINGMTTCGWFVAERRELN